MLLLAQQLPVRIFMLPSHACGDCHCQLHLCQDTLPHLVPLVRLFRQPPFGPWLSSSHQSYIDGRLVFVSSHPSHLCISSPSSDCCEPSSFSATGPSGRSGPDWKLSSFLSLLVSHRSVTQAHTSVRMASSVSLSFPSLTTSPNYVLPPLWLFSAQPY